MNKIVQQIIDERTRQDNKWGVQNHSTLMWSAILTEETGEVAKAALESSAAHKKLSGKQLDTLEDYRKELIQVAAVAIAAIESLDRNELNDDKAL